VGLYATCGGVLAQHGVTPGGHPSYGTQGYLDQQSSNNSNEIIITAGTITSGNASGLSFTMKSDASGMVRTIQTSTTTQFVREQPIVPGDLKVNDVVHVHISATTGVAESIIDGAIPPALQPGAKGNSAGAGSTTQSTSSHNGPVAGQIKSLSPLVVTYANGGPVTVKVSQYTRISRIVPIAFSNLTVGSHIFATGTVANNGTFMAIGVGITGVWGANGSGTSQTGTTGSTGTTTSGGATKTGTTTSGGVHN
jgi:hypothetical protein